MVFRSRRSTISASWSLRRRPLELNIGSRPSQEKVAGTELTHSKQGGQQVIVEGTKELEASREVVWSVINDPAQMAGLMPGVEGFEIKDDRHWQAKVKVPLGLGGLKMTIDFEKLEERPPEFASMNAKGKGVGAMMNMTTSFTLSGEGDHTSMDWSADVKIAGPVGSMGQRVLQPIINQQVGNVLTALEVEGGRGAHDCDRAS